MPFWLNYYDLFFQPCDLYVHSDGSTDDTELQCRAAGVNFYAIPPGTVQVGHNDRYVKGVIADLLNRYECVLFAESPDDIIVPGAAHNHDLRVYLNDFLQSDDRYRFLSGINVVQMWDERPYDPSTGKLLSQRSGAVRCPQYDNPFLWKDVPLWGRGWHDLGGRRLVGHGDLQGENKRLYNLHIHYADFDLCNRRHHQRLATFDELQKKAYACAVDSELRDLMRRMLDEPQKIFADGRCVPVEPWMKNII